MSHVPHKCSDSVCSERYCANRCPFFTPEEELQNTVLVRLKRPEGYEDVHPELVMTDANINAAFEPELVQPSSDSPASGVERSNLPDLHSAIMNLRHKAPDDCMTPNERMGYATGHRDARHAAAELVAARAALKETSHE